MKIQKGIVKYKDRSDIVCTYGLTDDGLQYYFLDETDTKKFSNGNRIVTTALVEAIDPMVKANNVGVIDDNGAIIIPFENRSIRPVNDNVIVVEKAVPTSQNVLDAVDLRNDASAAAKLVSTPAVIKDKINAQMGVEGKYVFNDQFSEATVCDINGTNLVGGESYSFISTANDKLYMSKNIPNSPVAEFSLTTYELVAAPVTNTIDVSTAVVDQQVVEDALNAQTVAPVDGTVAVDPNAVAAPVDGTIAVDPNAVAAPVDGTVAVDPNVVAAPVDGTVAVDPNAVAAPVDGTIAVDSNSVAAPVDGTVAVDPNAVAAPVTNDFNPADISAPTEGLAAVDTNSVVAPVGGVPVDAVASNPVEDVVMAYDDSLSTVEEPTPVDITVPVDPTAVTDDLSVVSNSIVENASEDAMSSAESRDFNPADAGITDDLKAFANGNPAEDVVESSENVDVPGTEVVSETAPSENESSEDTKEITDSLNTVSENTGEENVSIDTNDEDEIPPIVEEDSKEGSDEDQPEDITEDVKEEKTDDKKETTETKVDEPKDEEPKDEEPKDEEKVEAKEEDKEIAKEVEDTKLDDSADEDVFDDDNPINIFDEVNEDVVPFDDIDGENKPHAKETSATPVAIDAETVLATVDKNKNGVIDSDELMVPSEEKVTHKSVEREFARDLFNAHRDIKEDYSFTQRPVVSYGSSSYTAPSSFRSDYSSMLTDVKPDRISYDSFSSGTGKDNIMADVARSMSELMRQNKEQRGLITQYQDKVESLESQARILSEKYKEQTTRYEALTGKLRALDEASGRLESRNQLLESRLHDQEKIIAAQERELKILRPQIEGKQDLVRLLADARTLLGSDTTSSYGYDDGDNYYRRVA